MGAGASADIEGKIKAASDEELATALASLSDADKAKLMGALGLEEAPYLSQAFKVLADGMRKMMEVGFSDEEPNPEQIQKDMEAMMGSARELMAKSFDHHDKSGDGVLGKEEAAAFFKHLLDENGDLMMNMQEFAVKQSMEAMAKAFAEQGDMPEDVKADMIAEIKKSCKEQLDGSKQEIAAAMVEYKANKEERDAAAFAVVDTAGDGTLNKEEFLEAFTFGSEKQAEVFKALGFDV